MKSFRVPTFGLLLVPVTVVCLLPPRHRAVATTWVPLDLRYLVFRHAELIVAGKVVREERPRRDGFDRVGIIEVSEVLYGPAKLNGLRLRLTSSLHGNEYRVGDEGVWFLRQTGDGHAVQEGVAQVLNPDPPRIGVEWAGLLFAAEHPDTFWPRHERARGAEPVKRLELTEAQKAKRTAELRGLVLKRVESDVKALSIALETAKANLDRSRAALDSHRKQN